MGYTRRDFIDGALEEIGLAAYNYDATAEELNSAMRRLDSMMAEWNARGIRVGYPIPSGPGTGQLTDETAAPDSAWEAIVTGLALRIAPSFGKTVMADTRTNFMRAYQALLNIHAQPSEVQPRKMPLGGGNKPYWWGYQVFTTGPVDRLVTGVDGVLEF